MTLLPKVPFALPAFIPKRFLWAKPLDKVIIYLYSKKVHFKIKIKFTITMGLIHFIGFVPLNTFLFYDCC